MAFGHYRVQFLHISDLHAKGPAEKEPWRRRRVLGKAWQWNLEAILEEEGPVDFVFFTGDAAQSGKPGEYAEVTDFLQALREELHVAPDRVFTVPGNHDIDRTVREDVWKSMRMHLAGVNDFLNVSRWINGIGRTPSAFEDVWRERILERERGYRQWVSEGLKRPELAPPGLGYRVPVTIPGTDFPVHIIGLDTAWLCGDNSDPGRLLLTENQIGRLATDEKGDSLPGLGSRV